MIQYEYELTQNKQNINNNNQSKDQKIIIKNFAVWGANSTIASLFFFNSGYLFFGGISGIVAFLFLLIPLSFVFTKLSLNFITSSKLTNKNDSIELSCERVISKIDDIINQLKKDEKDEILGGTYSNLINNLLKSKEQLISIIEKHKLKKNDSNYKQSESTEYTSALKTLEKYKKYL